MAGPSDKAQGGARAKRVLRTGLAVVHEGELVLPAGGSEAEAESASDDPRAVVHYYFPVEIEVVANTSAVDTERITRAVLGRLASVLADGE